MGKAQKYGIGIAVIIALSILAKLLPEETLKREPAIQEQQRIEQMTAIAQLAPEEVAHGFTREANVSKYSIDIMDIAPAKLNVTPDIAKGYAEEVIKEVINNLSAAELNPKAEDIDISVRLAQKAKSVTGNDQIISYGRYRYRPVKDIIEWVNGAG